MNKIKRLLLFALTAGIFASCNLSRNVGAISETSYHKLQAAQQIDIKKHNCPAAIADLSVQKITEPKSILVKEPAAAIPSTAGLIKPVMKGLTKKASSAGTKLTAAGKQHPGPAFSILKNAEASVSHIFILMGIGLALLLIGGIMAVFGALTAFGTGTGTGIALLIIGYALAVIGVVAFLVGLNLLLALLLKRILESREFNVVNALRGMGIGVCIALDSLVVVSFLETTFYSASFIFVSNILLGLGWFIVLVCFVLLIIALLKKLIMGY